jgi:hypothetical protein
MSQLGILSKMKKVFQRSKIIVKSQASQSASNLTQSFLLFLEHILMVEFLLPSIHTPTIPHHQNQHLLASEYPDSDFSFPVQWMVRKYTLFPADPFLG